MFAICHSLLTRTSRNTSVKVSGPLTTWRTFVTVCRLGSLSAAAGEAFRLHAQTAVNAADRAFRAARDARDGSPARSLAVGATPSLAAGVVPAAMRGLLDEDGPLPWQLVPGLTGELYERTVNGELDLALVTDAPPGLPGDSRLERQFLGTDEMMVVLPAGHRLAGAGPARIEELADETWAEDNEGTAALLRQHAARAGVTARIDLNAADLPGKIALVATGHAIALTPSVMVTTLRADVTTLRLFDPPTRGIYSVRPRLDPHPSAELLIRQIVAIISLPIGRVGRLRSAHTDVTLRVLPDA